MMEIGDFVSQYTWGFAFSTVSPITQIFDIRITTRASRQASCKKYLKHNFTNKQGNLIKTD